MPPSPIPSASFVRNPATKALQIASLNSYVACPVSATTALGGSGGDIGDFLDFVTIVPGTLSPGAVQIKDGSGAAITIFTGGADSVGSLVPFAVPVGSVSALGGWEVITGANVTALAAGQFA